MTDDPRFTGISHLYGQAGLEVFQNSHVAVAGIGGVGSWIVEALARSGVGQLTLIDMDEVCVSNTNRQIHALSSTVGQPKIEVMRDRCVAINPQIQVHTVFDFVSRENVSQTIHPNLDFFVDAIDNALVKAAIAAECRRKKCKLVVIGAAGGKIDPSMVRLGPLHHSKHDPLLKRMKQHLKKDFGLKDPLRGALVKAVFSAEPVRYPDGQGGVCEEPQMDGPVKLDCASGFGAVSLVTGTYGFFAAHRVLTGLLESKER